MCDVVETPVAGDDTRSPSPSTDDCEVACTTESAIVNPQSPIDNGDLSVESVVEAVLFASDKPLPARRIVQILGIGDGNDVREHVATLNERYASTGSSFRIEAIAKGYQMLTLPVYDKWLGQLIKRRRESRLSQAALETLAVVAYKQPSLRADVEAIRGVAVGDMLSRLREMKLVKVVGRADEIGRPLLYGTTNRFLEVFGLSSLKELPNVEELVPPEEQKPQRSPDVPDDGPEPPETA